MIIKKNTEIIIYYQTLSDKIDILKGILEIENTKLAMIFSVLKWKS